MCLMTTSLLVPKIVNRSINAITSCSCVRVSAVEEFMSGNSPGSNISMFRACIFMEGGWPLLISSGTRPHFGQIIEAYFLNFQHGVSNVATASMCGCAGRLRFSLFYDTFSSSWEWSLHHGLACSYYVHRQQYIPPLWLCTCRFAFVWHSNVQHVSM